MWQRTLPAWLRELPALQALRRIWLQNYSWDDNQLLWREAENIPPTARFISSPYDDDAHYARKHTTQWIGYKVHLTETCDDDQPHLITHVETTIAPAADGAATPQIHAALEERHLLPQTHFERSAYGAPATLAKSASTLGISSWLSG